MRLQIYGQIRHLALFTLLVATVGCVAKNPGSIERGSWLYGQCSSCHGKDGAGNEEYKAPAIAGLHKEYVLRQLNNFRDGVRGAHPDDVYGLRMRAMARTLRNDADVEAVAAYIDSLQPVVPTPTLKEGDAARGKVLFATCAACHGKAGQGNLAVNAPALNYSNDWYQLTQIRNFRSGVRGTKAADTFGAQMRPMAMTLPNEQAILDVIAYIGTLRN